MQIYTEKGKIYKIMEPQVKSDKFKKQELIIQVNNPTEKGTFIEYLRFQCINEIMSQLDGAKKGDFVICKFKISGRKIGKDEEESFYTNLDVMEIKIINKADDIIKADIRPQSNSYSDQFPGIDSDDEDDILSVKSDNATPIEDDLSF